MSLHGLAPPPTTASAFAIGHAVVLVPQGTLLFQKGARSDEGMYSVVSGRLGVFAEDQLGSNDAGPSTPSLRGVGTPVRPDAASAPGPSSSMSMRRSSVSPRAGTTAFQAAINAQQGRRTLLYVGDMCYACRCSVYTHVDMRTRWRRKATECREGGW